jgi:hypothetical protein
MLLGHRRPGYVFAALPPLPHTSTLPKWRVISDRRPSCGQIAASPLLAIFPSDCYATPNSCERDFASRILHSTRTI